MSEFTEAFKYGWNAYVDGKPLYENPYDPFTFEYNEWLNGWDASKEAAA